MAAPSSDPHFEALAELQHAGAEHDRRVEQERERLFHEALDLLQGDGVVELTDGHLLALETTWEGRQVIAVFPGAQARVDLLLAIEYDAWVEANPMTDEEAQDRFEAGFAKLTPEQQYDACGDLLEAVPRIAKIRRRRLVTLRAPRSLPTPVTATRGRTRSRERRAARSHAPPALAGARPSRDDDGDPEPALAGRQPAPPARSVDAERREQERHQRQPAIAETTPGGELVPRRPA